MAAKLFVQYYIKRIRRYFTDGSSARALTAAAMLVVFFLVGLGVFLFAFRGFEFSQKEQFIAEAAPLYIYELFILIIGFLIFASSIIAGIFTFFRRQDSGRWIAVTPSYNSLAWTGFTKVIIGASWPFILIALPILLAARSVFSIALGGFTLSFFALVSFSVFCASLGILVVFLSAYGSVKLGSGTNTFRLLVLFSLLFMLIGGYATWDGLVNTNVGELFQIEDIELAVATIDRIVDNFKYYPSHLPALTMHSAQTGNTGVAFNYFTANALMLAGAIFAYYILKRGFLRLWQVFSEGGFEARKRINAGGDKNILYSITTSIAGLGSIKTSSRALFKKELLENLRTAKNIMWAGFLTFL
ncbi:MAG: hypothetical protein R3251_03180, partial [Candidatus Spechtbacterales bacterium]|nr:hypothetical protein [Candidatus Spechtbacterales bacterium]